MCILSLDSSTLPSASMTPGKVRRAPGRAGELTAATLCWKRTSVRWLSGELDSSPAVCRGLPLSSILCLQCHNTPRWRRASLTRRRHRAPPRKQNCHPPPPPTDGCSRSFPSPRACWGRNQPGLAPSNGVDSFKITKVFRNVSESHFQPRWPSFGYLGVIWPHLEIRVWPTWSAESDLSAEVHIGACLTPPSGFI